MVRFNHILINNSAFAREMGMSVHQFEGKRRAKSFTDEENERIKEILIDMFCWCLDVDEIKGINVKKC